MVIKQKEVGKGASPRYFLKEGEGTVAFFDDLETAGIVCRFLKGSHLDKPDYIRAMDAIREWDVAHKYKSPQEEDDTE